MADVFPCNMFTHTHTHTHTQLYLFIYLHQVRKQIQVKSNCYVVEFIEVNCIVCNNFMVLFLQTNHISWSLITEPIDKAVTLLLASYTDLFSI